MFRFGISAVAALLLLGASAGFTREKAKADPKELGRVAIVPFLDISGARTYLEGGEAFSAPARPFRLGESPCQPALNTCTPGGSWRGATAEGSAGPVLRYASNSYARISRRSTARRSATLR